MTYLLVGWSKPLTMQNAWTTTGDKTNKRKQVKGVNSYALCAEGFLQENRNTACLAASKRMIVATFLINFFTAQLLWRFVEVKAHCSTGTCLKYPLDVYGDSVHDTEFVGHVFQNSVKLNPIQCYTWCVKDCRCLSFNYKENNEENYCELNEENHFTNKSFLKPSRRSRYYVLHREHQQQAKIT